MAVITNRNTQQTPITSPTGAITGVQSVKHIPAARVYLAPPLGLSNINLATYSAYSAKSNGQTPSSASWLDMGVMDGAGKITYTKNMKKVQTGVDKITQAVYVDTKDAMIDFSLWQTDDYVLQQLGFASSTVTAGSSVVFKLGQDDVVQKALLFVSQNKLDGKELQFFHPSAALIATFDETPDGLLVKVTCELLGFTVSGDTNLTLVAVTVFA